MTSDSAGILPVHSAQCGLAADACASKADFAQVESADCSARPRESGDPGRWFPAVAGMSGDGRINPTETCSTPLLDLPAPDRRRRPRKRQETRAARRERLYRAAGEAIARAAETDGDPVALMVAATGAEAKYCDPVIRQHPLFQKMLLVPGERRRKRRERRRKALERRRKAQDARDAAALASLAVAEPVVWVRREFRKRRRAAYRMADLSGLHWSDQSGGRKRKANRQYLHAYVWCDAMIAGAVGHSCRHGPPPHRIKVCITKVDNKKTWREIECAAPARANGAGAHGFEARASLPGLTRQSIRSKKIAKDDGCPGQPSQSLWRLLARA
jgi:hypothetical protein